MFSHAALCTRPRVAKKLVSTLFVLLFAGTCVLAQSAPARSFTLKSFIPFGENGSPYDAAIGQFTTSGFSDIVALDNPTFEEGSISVFPGRGDGTFDSASYSFSVVDPISVAVGDVNGDSKQDFVVYSVLYANVFLGNGDGTFQTPAQYPLSGANREIFGKARLGDLNGDGHLDIVISTQDPDISSGTLQVLLNTGAGTFGAPEVISLPYAADGMAVADFDHDGKLDAAVSQIDLAQGLNSSINIYRGNGDGTLVFSQVVPLPDLPFAVEAGDLNRDGYADLVITSSSIYVSLNTNGTFAPIASYTLPNNALALSATLNDFNKDGKLDVAAVDSYTSKGERFYVLPGKGDGTLRTQALTITGTPTGGTTYGQAITSGFLNCDSNPARCGTHAADAVVVFKGSKQPIIAGLDVQINK